MKGRERAALRADAHHLSPTVHVGKEGLSASLITSLDDTLRTHELVKVKLGKEAPESREDTAATLSSRTSSAVAQTLGRTILFYRRHPKKPRIVLPNE